MTVSSSSSRIAYIGDATTTAFAFPYEFSAGSDLKVYKAGVLQTITTHYTVSGGGGSSGTVTFVTAPAAAESIVIYDDPPVTQLLDYIANDPFPAESHEGGLDKLTRIARRFRDQLARAMRLSDTDVSGASTVLPTPSAQKILGWNAAANALVNYSASDLATVAVYGAAQYQEFSGNGATTAFTLTSDPGSVNNLDIDIGGVSQRNGIDFTVSGTTLTFTSAPTTGTNNIHVKWMQALPQGITNANAVNYTPGGSGAVVRTVEAKLRDTVSTADFGVLADGVADDTAALQAAITATRSQGGDQRTLLWRKGTNKVTGQLTIGTNQHIVFEPGVVIDATGLPNETTSLFAISNQSNVHLEGNGATINGARATANPAIEGSSAAFYVYGSDNVLIRDFNVAGFATDAITLTGDNGASGPCTNVRIEGCDCSNNRRNGLSIIHAIGVVVTGGRYWGSNGAPAGPHAGIDVEPNANQVCQDILIQGVRTQANDGPGLLMVPSLQSSSVGTEFDVTVVGYRSEEDGSLSGHPALRFANGGALTNKIYGQVVVNGATIVKPKSRGVSFTNWDADKAPEVILRDVLVIDPDGTSSASGNENRTGFVVSCDATQATANMGNIVMENCRAIDTRGSPRMPWGFLLDADVGTAKTLKNIRVRNPQSTNFVATAKYDVNVNATINGGCSGVSVTYDSPRLVTALASAAIGAWVGKRITAQTGGNTYTLPALANSVGAHYELFAPSSLGSNVSFTAQAGQNIKANGAAAANTLVVAPGDCWRVWNPDGLQWVARAEA